MMLVGHSIFCQYPTVKTIGKDTVVIMTLKQGEDINKKFTKLNDSIIILNDTIVNLKNSHKKYMIKTDQRIQTINNNYKLLKTNTDSIKIMYLNTRKKYLESEKNHKREVKNLSIFTLISFFIAVFVVAST